MPDFDFDPVVRHEIDVLRHQLLRNRVELTTAGASFVDPHVLHLEDKASGLLRRISADLLALAAQLAQRDLIKVVCPSSRFTRCSLLRHQEHPIQVP